MILQQYHVSLYETDLVKGSRRATFSRHLYSWYCVVAETGFWDERVHQVPQSFKMPGNEPLGLNMSLDALIEKRGTERASGSGVRGAGRGRGLGIQGGVNKSLSSGNKQTTRGDLGQNNFNNRNNASNRGAGRGYNAGRGPGPSGRGNNAGFDQSKQGSIQARNPISGPSVAMVPDVTMTFMQMQAAMATMQEQARIIAQQQEQLTMLLQAQASQTVARASAPAIAASVPVQQKVLARPKQVVQVEPEPEELDVECECLIDEETGDTLVQLQGITIVTVSPSGEVVLSTGGWYTPDTIAGMNKALKPIGMKVVAIGDPEEGEWHVIEGANKRIRFEDNMRIPPKGVNSANRASVVVMAFEQPVEPQAQYAPPVATHRPVMVPIGSRGAVGGSTRTAATQPNDFDAAARRLRAQGRSY
ncbi:hypothetical protein CEUSTIGMA_g11556.t1 [Chlamydomonas eustigma]|uniref:Uncharacterized protein n=1 Tax=Chlamydomonas eustigma TaxID=1157962 RepID=A0A250XM79_9CHLO|nr:hypothetical protein CEUSTIGMA_g11556.t1 [Chlamydomonas eustigma]|eukprot:GAX84133.1 hypothetical protein CEUSTIGMA_g11556.t1 [Chlamydomonas eustigma]